MKTRYNLLSLAFLLFLLAGSAMGQGNVARKSQPKKPEQSQPVSSAKKLKDDFIKATEDYKASLNTLLSTYQTNLKTLSDRSAQLKQLYSDGIISKRELDDSQTAIAEAQTKVDETRKQLAAADVQIAQTKQAPDVIPYSGPTMYQGNRAWSTGNARFDALIRQNGTRFGVDPYLIYCVMQQESHFNPVVVSPKGAQGLMQLMPDTAARYGVTNSLDPAQSVQAGAHYLKDLLQMFGGRVDLVLAGYNAGEGAVIKFGQRIPPYKETQDYVHLIIARYLGGVRQ
jgi:soluble lytic murein transglycosylase-like protein